MNTLLLLASAAPEGDVSETLTIFITLLSGAAVVGVLTKFIRLPYTIALVLAGLTVAIIGEAPPQVVITHDLVFVLFLPPLLFQAGLHLDLELLQRKAGPVAVLAIPGVVITTFGVGLAIRYFIPENVGAGVNVWLAALLFGAMLAPTDPISVLATFKSTGAPSALRTLVEGESLFNDGTGVVVFIILLGAVFPLAAPVEHSDLAPGGHDAVSIVAQDAGHVGEAASLTEAPGSISIAQAVQQFVQVVGLGLVMGLGLGLIAFWLLRRLDDHVLENAITVVLVWGSYIMTEHIGGSGVIAVVVAGLILGNYGHRLAMSQRTSDTINAFWESIDFIVNSIVFLLIGFELQEIGVSSLLHWNVIAAVGAVLLALYATRALMVYPACAIFGNDWPRGWKHIIWWAGLKGSIPMALVLGLPAGGLKTFLMPVAFGVVLVSLLLQGLTMPLLMRAVGVTESGDEEH